MSVDSSQDQQPYQTTYREYTLGGVMVGVINEDGNEDAWIRSDTTCEPQQ